MHSKIVQNKIRDVKLNFNVLILKKIKIVDRAAKIYVLTKFKTFVQYHNMFAAQKKSAKTKTIKNLIKKRFREKISNKFFNKFF